MQRTVMERELTGNDTVENEFSFLNLKYFNTRPFLQPWIRPYPENIELKKSRTYSSTKPHNDTSGRTNRARVAIWIQNTHYNE